VATARGPGGRARRGARADAAPSPAMGPLEESTEGRTAAASRDSPYRAARPTAPSGTSPIAGRSPKEPSPFTRKTLIMWVPMSRV
jgi:hypothetical protein